MTDIHTKGLRLNAVTGPRVNAPAVSPDTLRDLGHPYYGFLQTYTLQSESTSWHGQLKNIGMQYSIPFSILLPPKVTELLQIHNDDTIILKPSILSEARTIYYKKLAADEKQISMLPELHPGMEIEGQLDYRLGSIAIQLVQWEPEGCYIGPGTQFIEAQGAPQLDYTPENQAAEVVTDVEDTTNPIQQIHENDPTN